jgi:hypothetical protein
MSTQVSNFGVSPKMIERLALSGIRGLNKYLFAVSRGYWLDQSEPEASP